MSTVDLIIPVYNEQDVLWRSAEAVLAWTDGHPEHDWQIVIAENGSTDATPAIAASLAERHAGRVRVIAERRAGRGRALRNAIMASRADVAAYMDADLSTDLVHIPGIVDPVAADAADIAIGSRLAAGSRTTRGWRRETTSRLYAFAFRHLGGLRVSDAQCGFKAISRDAARAIVPLTTDDRWFFDTELLMIAQRNGYRIIETPVRWVEDPDSSVPVARTAAEFLAGLLRLRRRTPRVERHVQRRPP